MSSIAITPLSFDSSIYAPPVVGGPVFSSPTLNNDPLAMSQVGGTGGIVPQSVALSPVPQTTQNTYGSLSIPPLSPLPSLTGSPTSGSTTSTSPQLTPSQLATAAGALLGGFIQNPTQNATIFGLSIGRAAAFLLGLILIGAGLILFSRQPIEEAAAIAARAGA
jgi:hypothetical protein